MQPLPIVCLEVDGMQADAAALDALARLALRLRRCGYQLTLGHASRELLELIELAGLGDVLAAAAE